MKIFAIFTGVSGFLGVAFGAFGSHVLKDQISPYLLGVWQTAVNYQMFHTLVLLAIIILAVQQQGNRKLVIAGGLFLVGIIIFSGSLYALALTGIKGLGMVTPIGGVLLLFGWLFFSFGLVGYVTNKKNPRD